MDDELLDRNSQQPVAAQQGASHAALAGVSGRGETVPSLTAGGVADAELPRFAPVEGSPLYEQVTRWLLSQVTSGRWPVHSMLPPEVTLATALGVSRVTIRRALGDLTKQGVFIRIAGRGTFVALGEGAQLTNTLRKVSVLKPAPRSEMRLIGVVIPSAASAFVSAIIAHLEHALYERGYRMLLANSRDSLSLQGEHLRQFVDAGVAGIVLYSASFLHDETVNTLMRRHIPLVMLDRYYPAITTHVVATDHIRSGYMMAEHLLRLSHRRIGYVLATTETVTSTLARFEGYKAALHDYGVSFDESLVMKAQIRPDTVKAYLEHAKQPTAVFASNDERAIEFASALRTLGLRTPDDVALVGCDDIPLVSKLDPPLTTIAQNVSQLGEATANLLIDTIEGAVTTPKSILIPPELVVRRSCGAAQRASHPSQAEAQMLDGVAGSGSADHSTLEPASTASSTRKRRRRA